MLSLSALALCAQRTPRSSVSKVVTKSFSASTHSSTPIFRTLRARKQANLINTPLQRGVRRGPGIFNRFNGCHSVRETVETVGVKVAVLGTQLKQGVNESGLFGPVQQCEISGLATFCSATRRSVTPKEKSRPLSSPSTRSRTRQHRPTVSRPPAFRFFRYSVVIMASLSHSRQDPAASLQSSHAFSRATSRADS